METSVIVSIIKIKLKKKMPHITNAISAFHLNYTG